METVVIVAGVEEDIYLDANADYIGVDYGTILCLNNDITPKISFGDFDSVADMNALNNLNLKIFPSEKDETDLELALAYAIRYYKKIIVSNCLGNRIDHELYNLKLLMKYDEIVLYSPNQIIYILNKGEHIIKNTHKYFSFFALKNTQISLIDFKYSLDNEIITPQDFRTISNELIEEKAKITINYGQILCIQTN